MDKVRVVLADDHPVTREGIKKLLSRASDILVVGEVENGADALKMVEELEPDVLLLDMEMPGLKGLEVAQALKDRNAGVHVLALSSYDDKQYIFGLLAAGAAGYLTKEEAPQTIVEAVRGVARGEQGWVSRKVAAIMATWARDEEDGPADLSPREIEVLGWVVKGKTNQEIGFELGISDKTVEKHLESVYTKLKVASRVEAAVLAVKNNLV